MANERSYFTFMAFNIVCLLIVGTIQIAYASITYSFSENYDFGSFYVGAFAAILAGLSISVRIKSGRIFYVILSIICIILALVGFIVDLSAATFLYDLAVCGNAAGKYFGDDDYNDALNLVCNMPKRTDTDTCYCTTYSNDEDIENDPHLRCYRFVEQDGFDAGNCDPVLYDYPYYASVSGWLCVLLFFLLIVFSAVGCSSCCCDCIKFDDQVGRVVPVTVASDDAVSSVGMPRTHQTIGINGQPPMVFSGQQYPTVLPPSYQQVYYGQQNIGHNPQVVVIREQPYQSALVEAPAERAAPLVELAGVRIIEENTAPSKAYTYNGPA